MEKVLELLRSWLAEGEQQPKTAPVETKIDIMGTITINAKQEKIAEEALKLIEEKFDFGKRLYRERSELYER